METTRKVCASSVQADGDPIAATWRRGAFRWIDPESGDQLRVELCGPPEWLAELAQRGFEILSEDPLVRRPNAAGGHAQLIEGE